MEGITKKRGRAALGLASSGSGQEGQPAQAYLVGAAYEGCPTKEKALVFVFAGKEYLVPFTNTWENNKLTASIVHLDLAERVISRPRATSRISEMIRTRVLSVEAQQALLRGVQAWFLPERGYDVRIVPFSKAANDPEDPRLAL